MESIKIRLPEEPELKPKITVIGVGGAGGNAVNNMISANLSGVTFWVANTDSQALENSLSQNKIQLGARCTRGLGAGSYPEVGKASAEESIDEIRAALEGCNMLFITAGMGGGTGTGAAPVVARAAKELGILVVGVVTKPFDFEGLRRRNVAELGLEEFENDVDTLIIIPNQNLFRVANEKTTFLDAFRMADGVLHAGVRGVTDLITMPGLINLDFADIRAVMHGMGKAMMGIGEAEGENRAMRAAEAAISNPLLDNSSMKGAKGVLINITGGLDMTLFEVDEAANRIREEVEPTANIIFGSAFNGEADGKLRVAVVATGIVTESNPSATSSALPFTDKALNTTHTQKGLPETHCSATVRKTQTQYTTSAEPPLSPDLREKVDDAVPDGIKKPSVRFSGVFAPPKAVRPGELEGHSKYALYSSRSSHFSDEAKEGLTTCNYNNHNRLSEVPANLETKSRQTPTESSTGHDNKPMQASADEKSNHNSFLGRVVSGFQQKIVEQFNVDGNQTAHFSTITKDELLDIPAFLRKKNDHK